jgi:outer membrane protein OmpA-like peptidoglycan-associated protein
MLAALIPAAMEILPGQTPSQPLPGSVEIGVFTRYTRFDRSLRLDDSYGVGGRLGLYVLPGLALEGAGTTMSTRGPLAPDGRLTSLHARLVYTTRPAGPIALLLGGGVVHNMYGTSANVSDDGVSGVLGFRLGRGIWAGRIEAVGDFIPSPANQSATVANNWNFAFQAGVSVALGAGRRAPVQREPMPPQLGPTPHFRVDTAPHPPLAPADADHDGVVDATDACPGTPAGEKVDAKGCPLPQDADSDGVVDSLDRCPHSAPGAPVDATGCPRDSDGDGVVDSADRCPNTPAGERVDVATGCPVSKDADGDGVPDSMDRCAGTPASERTDGIGCPLLFEGTQRTLILEGVRFEVGGAALTMEGRAVLDRVALSLKAHREFWVEVAGYTDNVGNAAANRRLSQLRADAVRHYLIGRGVPATQLMARGYGASDPIDTNTTAVGRARNRRVELHRLS